MNDIAMEVELDSAKLVFVEVDMNDRGKVLWRKPGVIPHTVAAKSSDRLPHSWHSYADTPLHVRHGCA